jgi:hypothetical protein
MKRLLLLVLVFLAAFLSTAQAQARSAAPATVKRTEEYCQLRAMPKLNGRYVVSIDYGQQRKLVSRNIFRDATGQAVEFNSVIDALNWLNEQGWEFVNAYVLVEDNESVSYYIMRRRLAG